MSVEHVDVKYEISFMGKQKGSIDVDIDWIDLDHGSVTGNAKMKMLKTFEYPLGEGSAATKNPDGSIHVDANLPSRFGNGTLDVGMDLTPDGNVTGSIPLMQGVALAITGKRA